VQIKIIQKQKKFRKSDSK